MCMVLCLYLYGYITCSQCLWKPEESIGFPGMTVTDGCERPYEFWESKLDLEEEQLVLLMVEPSFHIQKYRKM